MADPYVGLHDADGTLLLPLLVQPNSDPILVEKFEITPPSVRDSVQVRSQGHGSYDRSRFYGAGAVTVEGTFIGDDAGSPWLYADQLKRYSQAGSRCYFHLQRADWDQPRRILVRGNVPTASYTEIQSSFQFSYAAPDGMLEAVDEDSATLFPLDADLPGISEPVFEPVYTEPGGVAGGMSVQVDGTVDCYPIVDLYGAAGSGTTNMTIEYAGQTVQFKTSAQVEAGHFWRVDFAAHTVYVDGDPSLTRYDQIDFPHTEWFALQPGAASVALRVPDPGSGCHAVLRWRPRWLP